MTKDTTPPEDNTVPEPPILEVDFTEPLERETQDYPELDEQGRWTLPKETKTVEE